MQPSLVCLQETKVEVIGTFLGVQFLGQRLNTFDYIRANGVKGGVLIAWDEEVIEAADPIMNTYSLSIKIKM